MKAQVCGHPAHIATTAIVGAGTLSNSMVALTEALVARNFQYF